MGGRRRYPPITHKEAKRILLALGFEQETTKRSGTSHTHWRAFINGKARKVTLDEHNAPYSNSLLRSIISQSGVTRIDFYSATGKTAAKIDL